ncbi:MAG TPA: DUF981 domain-containing protein [Thermotoga sp.]|jgi:putative membrane protein|uniref:DUF981 domain-containing protein n=2 Tax=Thermotoga petrophila TaxID=93929 RepID=A5IM47_THEP1|nr:DUF981 family protein [Thermotoga petrophila]ABQ47270.1 protein of unknown function DUF981 [Thermotoga petrophila RKU-1]ADA67357.1 protein of unknown function DUF981 [Thermotoga petrophila RKU-10]HBF69566.1 DUF981 domain-containing protein [Thermotoga sp.]
MFVDYLTVFMADVVAGLGVLIAFVLKGLNDSEKAKSFAPAFAAVGLLAIATGLHMVLTWPLPGSHNIAFGEPFLLYGFVFLAAAIAVAKGWDLMPTTIFALFAGIYAIIVGGSIIGYGMTRHPFTSGLGFIAAGLVGVLSPVVWKLRENKIIRFLGVVLLALTLLLWFITMYGSVTGHINPQGSFGKWTPIPMR